MKQNLRSPFLAMLLVAGMAFSGRAQTLLSLNKPAFSSTDEPGYPPSNAVDGSSTSFWSSQSTGYIQTLGVNLQTRYDIEKVSINFASGRYALTFDIQGSNNGNDWVTLKTIPPGNTKSSLTIDSLYGKYQYVRFQGRGRANTAGYRIADFKVYGYALPTPAEQAEMNVVAGRLISEYSTQENGNLNILLSSMLANGSWPITYTGSGWTSHSLRLNNMAKAYRNPANSLYNHPDVPAKFMRAMRFFINSKFVSPPADWHDNDIRSPNNVVSGLLMMKGAIPTDSLLAYAATVLDRTDNAGHKGTNRSWVSMTLIRKGLVMDRYENVKKGYQSMVSALNIADLSSAEGIRIDSSFHQHRNQIQTGSYGVDFVYDEAKYLNYVLGTSFYSLYNTTQRNNLRGAILGGLRYLSYRSAVDFGTIGRAIGGKDNAVGKVKPALMDAQALNDPVNDGLYQNWKAHLTGGPFPATKAKHFWLSNMLVSRGPNFYMSAKIASVRNTGAEAIKGSNLKGWNLPFGATNIMTAGTEYENIFPSWNWSRIPGTTAEMSEAAASTTFGTDQGYVTASNTYGGGLSVNEVGIIAFPLDNKRGVTAKKAYFFMENMMLCVGNSITASKSNEIVTTVNQTKLSGNITIQNGGTISTFSGDSINTTGLNWVNHRDIGYLFPNGGNIFLSKKLQWGTWESLGGGVPKKADTNLVFNLYAKHGLTPTNGTYYYIVAPNKSAADMPALYSGHGFVLVSNTANIQAIQHNGITRQYAVVFYNPGQVTMPDGLVIKSDKKAIVQIKKYSTNYRISVSDPEYTGSNIKITLNVELNGPGTSFSGGETAITLSMFSGDEKGKTYTGFYGIISGAPMGRQANSSTDIQLQQADEGPLSEPLGNDIVLYPNPTSSTLTVKGISKDAKIEVYDLWGRKYKTVNGNSLDVSELQNGSNYFLRIHDQGKVIRKQFIKE